MAHDQETTADGYRTEALRLRSALYDKTTGLPALPLLFDRLRVLLEKRRHLGVVHIEIENLKLVESLYGWQVFDGILSRASTVLRESVGTALPEGALLAIVGVAADRLVAFLPDSGGREVDAASLAGAAAKVRARLETMLESREFTGLSPGLSFRVGYALLSEDPFYRFERRVYGAVEEARTLSDRKRRRRESTRTAEIRRIIRDATVSTVFQPVVDLGTREILGFEALVRGPKDSSFEMPRPMFAASHDVGVEADLDRLCRDTALRDSATLARGGKVFLNVLPGSLADPAWLADGVRSRLQAAALSPADLVLEVSERAADADLERTVADMERLKARGFSLALDDVGTGYATLATLEKVRPDYLKVDASLVKGIERNLIKRDLVVALVNVASRMGASVIAEGVEAEGQVTVLRDAGVRYGQGYLFAPPSAGPGGKAGKPRRVDH